MIKLICSSIILFFCVKAVGQITGGGKAKPSTPSQTEQNEVGASGPASGYGTFYFSYISPGSKLQEEGLATAGVGFGGDYVNFFKQVELGNNLELGLLISWNVNATFFDLEQIDPEAYLNIPYIFGDVKLGPSFTYKFSEKSGVSTYFKLGPMVGVGSGYYYSYIDGTDDWGNEEYEFQNVVPTGVGFGIKPGLGVQLYFNKLFLGIDFNPGTLTFPREDSDSEFETEENVTHTRFNIGWRWAKK